jgi:multidrug efflux pump subunit AcrA (membrane-fusion protein)
VADGAPHGWRRHPRILGLGGLAVAAVAVGIAVWATTASGVSGFRTAQATMATVRQTLPVSGTVDPVSQTTAAFQVAGSVSAVDVSLGQSVTAGQTLATLDPTTLEQNVSSAQSTLTADDAKLAEDEAAQSSTDPTTPTSSSTVSTTTTPASASNAAKIQQAQQAVVTAQQTADADTQTASADLASAQSTCSGSTTTPSTTTTSTTTPPTTTTTTTAPTTTTTTAPSGSGGSTMCTDGLNAALTAQQQVATDQKAVATAENTLAKLLSSTSTGSTGTSTGGSSAAGQSTGASSSGAGTTPSSGSGITGGSGATAVSQSGGNADSTPTDTPAQLASDQAAIDSANASLIDAQQDLADATLVTPIAGTVASVDLAAGQSVTAGSTTDVITVINSGSFEFTGSLTSSQSTQVHVGDSAQVTVDGTNGSIQGAVAQVGPVDDSDSSYTYPVVVALPAGSHGIAAGSSAQVNIVLKQVADTLAVPTSAVNTVRSGDSYVVVLASGSEERKAVSVGVVGAEYTQITKGIADGQSVVLADLSTPVPSSSTATTTFGGFGGFGGAGGGARFAGGGFVARVGVGAAAGG